LQYIFVLYLEHPSLSSLFSGVRVAPSLVFCVMVCRSMFVFLYFFLFSILLSVLFDYPVGIFKIFLFYHTIHVGSKNAPHRQFHYKYNLNNFCHVHVFVHNVWFQFYFYGRVSSIMRSMFLFS
jgi:hypothetical protein